MPRITDHQLQRVAVCSDFDPPAPNVLAVTIAEAQRIAGIGRTSLYEAISDGRIEAVKAGARTLILMDSLRAFIGSLPRIGPSGSGPATHARHA